MKFIVIADSWANTYYRNETFLSSQELNNYTFEYEKDHCWFNFYRFFLESLGHEVLDLAWPGRSNLENIAILEEESNTDVDFIIWLHTHPTRDFIDYCGPGEVNKKTRNRNVNFDRLKTLDLQGLLNWSEECSDNTIEDLKHLAETKFTNTHFLCLGGCGYLGKKHFDNHKHHRLHHVMPSIMENVVSNVEQDLLLFSSWNKIAEHFDNHSLVNELIDISEKHYSKIQLLHCAAWPDSTHPNASTAIATIDKIFTYIEENQLTPLGSV
jgi:hypothetical protein